MNQLRIIKITVFIFTFLLIMGCLTMIGLMYRHTTRQSHSAITENNLQQPPSATIKQIAADGNLLYILVSTPNQADKIIIFDSKKNNIVSNLITY